MSAKLYSAEIVHISGQPVQRIRLKLNTPYAFEAGQYLQIETPSGALIPMSIASAPALLPELELHFRAIEGNAEAHALSAALRGTHLNLSAAAGDVRSGRPDQPLLVIAGGSGAAQAFSCSAHRSAVQASAPTIVLWCADHADEVYAERELASRPHTQVQVCIDDRRTAENEGLVWLRQHGAKYRDAYVLLAGGPGFVYAATDVLFELGFSQAQLHSDVYAYAPREL